MNFLGIARERVYSPGKVDADRAILEAVAQRLETRHRVRTVSADEPLPEVPPETTVFAMCQGPLALSAMHGWEAEGVRVINSPRAIENCHRRRTISAFERHRVPHPTTILVRTAEPETLPAWVDDGAWLKRGDVHATEAADVVRVGHRAAAREVLAGFRARAIETAAVQRHIGGNVIKFYGVRGLFFTCFPAQETAMESAPGDQADVAALAERGAVALGLEVFGGDCVRDRQGGLWLIDLNDWPSYAPCLNRAADAISTYLDTQTS